MNEIVKYENHLNEVPLKDFNPIDLDLLMYFCHKFKDKKGKSITFEFAEIKEAIGYNKKHRSKSFVNHLVEMNGKLLSCNFMLHKENGDISQFALFDEFTTSPKNQTITVSIHPNFQFLLNKEDEKEWFFTRFELNNFLSIKSGYAKECYRRLKQFRTTGLWNVKIDEFRRLLDIPESYRIREIDTRVLKPIEKELSSFFSNLKITKIKKKGRGRGGIVDRLEFRFDKEVVEKSTESFDTETKNYYEPKSIGRNCPECGKPLFELSHNGSVYYGHYFYEQGDECSIKYNSIAEIDGIDEIPQRNEDPVNPKIAELLHKLQMMQ